MAKKFPDLTGDGKVTQADILKGRGVPGFKDGKSVRVPIEPDNETLDRIERERRESGILFSQTAQDIEDIMAGGKRKNQKGGGTMNLLENLEWVVLLKLP